ncbi:MAG: hypothetical protein IJL43_05895 [Lachnospiraceae bacterium]|nr:hypothetical protein [Lachnospiraceae bacterium]
MNGNSNPEERGRVIMMAMLRAGVSGYLIYLGYSLIRDQLNGSSAMAPWLTWAAGVVFILAGIGFLFYTWKHYRAETKEKTAEDSEGDASKDIDADVSESTEGPLEEHTEDDLHRR